MPKKTLCFNKKCKKGQKSKNCKKPRRGYIEFNDAQVTKYDTNISNKKCPRAQDVLPSLQEKMTKLARDNEEIFDADIAPHR